MAVKGKRGPALSETVTKDANKVNGDAGEKAEPKQKRLPEMQDSQIEEIEAAAEAYDKVKKERLAKLRKELDLKDVLLQTMKRHKKPVYHHDGFLIEIVPEGEKLRVKIDKSERE